MGISSLKYSLPAGAMGFLETHPLAARLLVPVARSRLSAPRLEDEEVVNRYE